MKTAQLVLLPVLCCSALYADNLLHPGTPRLDRPTLTALGVQLPVSGDDNFNATVTMQYRITGTSVWQNALPLFRVHPETVAGYTVAPQFGGSIFDLRPGTTYDIQLHAVDPDGADQFFNLTGATRPVPGDPANPRVVNVSDSASLTAAINSAAAGDIITLANGTYPGTFRVYQAGTAANPIVIRGASQDGVILDGQNCTGCNIIEIYGGGYVHLERMTIQNAERAIRVQSDGSSGNVMRRLHIKNTQLGIGGRSNQNDGYIADNILEGRLTWPHVYFDDGGARANDDGIAVFGSGIVVAHNRISGYGDAMKTSQDGARANDFFGNEVLYTYDNGIELDGSEGNTRCFRNRFTNTFATLSVQPVHGGPSYLFRNIVLNAVTEQIKMHALGGNPPQEPSGVLVYNNTFLSPPNFALTMQTSATGHYFEIENNLFLAPATSGPETADWTGSIDHGTFDYNGYFPDGIFRFNNPLLGGYFLQRSFAGLQGLGMEQHGVLAAGPLFASGLTPPADYRTLQPPPDVTPLSGAVYLDKGRVLSNINDNFQGSGPDFGAVELGCPTNIYGPRPDGVDESNEVTGCSAANAAAGSLSLAPARLSLGRSQTQQFTATIAPLGTAVSWRLTPARGTIDANGFYTAPADAQLGETVTVTAVSAQSAAIFANATISLTAPVTVGLTPATVTIAGLQTQQFTPAVSGALNQAVTYSLSPAIGFVSTGGLYTAPAASASAQTVTLTVTSAADPSKTSAAVITISPVQNSTGGGALQGTSSFLTSASLTTEGTVDWAHWGNGTPTRKNVPVHSLGDIGYISTGNTFQYYSNDLRASSWTDGTNIPTATANRDGIYMAGIGNGFSFNVPASPVPQVLSVHVGGWRSSGRMTATLSDGSANPYSEDVPYTAGQYGRDYVFNYHAGSNGQTLTLKWVNTGGDGNGNVTWTGIALGSVAGGTGLLQGSANSLASASLTTEGTIDWVHWGDDAVNRKSIPAPVIGDLAAISSGNSPNPYKNDLRTIAWSAGKPLVSQVADRNGLFIAGLNNGFSLTVPASTTAQVLRLHVGGWNSSGRLTATLSDGSAVAYIEDVPFSGGQYDRDYVLNFRGASANQSITVKWVVTGGGGNVTWSAAALGLN